MYRYLPIINRFNRFNSGITEFNSIIDTFDHLFDNGIRAGAGRTITPPCNIETVNNNDYCISMQVPGFDKNNITVSLKDSVLSVSGQQVQSDNKTDTKQDSDNSDQQKPSRYLSRDFIQSNFKQAFDLSEGVEVQSVKLNNGILRINLHRQIPEQAPAQILSIDTE